MNQRDTRAARGGWAEPGSAHPSVAPIFQTTAFDIDDLDHLDRITSGEEQAYVYTRDGNPNLDAFANDVASLEGAEAGTTFASGMGGLAAVMLTVLRHGDHMIAARGLYGRTVQLIDRLAETMQLDVSWVDATDASQFSEAMTPGTRLAFIESVSNPLLEVSDLPAIRAATDGVTLLVDSTFTTPALLRPIEHGVDIVFHSASKYLNGHGDVMLGVVVGSQKMVTELNETTSLFGMNGSPFECWLASRGLRSLELRMDRVSSTAQKLAETFSSDPRVDRVHYPGLESHGTHDIANRLMPSGFGGMLSVHLTGGREAAQRFIGNLKAIPFSPTLADARTTVSYPAGTSHRFLTPDQRDTLGIGDGLVRISTGIESPADLLTEFQSALNTVSDMH